MLLTKLSLFLSQSQGQADLLKHAKSEALDTLRQIHCAAQSCGLSKNGAASPQLQHHPHHQPQQVQIQQQPQTKAHPQPPPLHQSHTQPQSQTAPQAYLHPLPQQHPQLPALPLVQTFSKPPAYPQPPPLPQLQFQFQSQQQRAAGPLDAIPEKEMVSDEPAGSCWPAACAHRESHPKRDRESEIDVEKQKGVEAKQEASNEREMQEVAERVKEMMMVRKTRRVRSETQVWAEVLSWPEGRRRKERETSHFNHTFLNRMENWRDNIYMDLEDNLPSKPENVGLFCFLSCEKPKGLTAGN